MDLVSYNVEVENMVIASADKSFVVRITQIIDNIINSRNIIDVSLPNPHQNDQE